MRKITALVAAIAWLGLFLMMTPIPFVDPRHWLGHFDPLILIYDALAVAGLVLAAIHFRRGTRSTAWMSLVLAVAGACYAFLSIFNLYALLTLKLGDRYVSRSAFIWG